MAGLHPGQGIDMRNVTDYQQTTDAVVAGMIVVCAITTALFLFFFLFRPFYTTRQGRALIVSAAGKAWLLNVLALPVTVFGDYPGRWFVRLIGMTVFMAGQIYLLWSLLTSPDARKFPPFKWRRK